MRVLALCVALCIALIASSAFAFLNQYTITNETLTFSFDVQDQPQWTLVTPEGTYSGAALDAAKFGGTFGLTFSDSEPITLNGTPIDARLTGKIAKDCGRIKITLRDQTNGRKYKLGSFLEDYTQTCAANN